MTPTGSRVVSSAVSFVHPFTLGHDARELPAGSYMAHTLEEAHAGLSHTAYVAVSVNLVVAEAPGRTASRVVRPADLDAALSRDRERTRATA